MIGIFDSGLGGLSVWLPLRKQSDCDILYLADEAHLPYGEKSPDALLAYTNAALAFFEQKQVEAVIFACGTVSCTVLPHLKNPPMPVLGVAEPALAAVCQRTVNRRVAIAATRATVDSGFYQSRLRRADMSVLALPCTPFVPLVEQEADKATVLETVQRLLSPVKEFGADVLLLGCTHYAFLKDSIRQTLPAVMQIDCGAEAAKAALKAAPLQKGRGKTHFYTTADTDSFAARLKRRLGTGEQEVEHITLK